MNSLPESPELNDMVVEFLRSMDMHHTVEAMEQEIRGIAQG